MRKLKGNSTQGDSPPAQNSQEELRRRAEEALAQQPQGTGAPADADAQRLIHELQIHQIELELQNEALRQSQIELETARDGYFDLFERAPVGYIVLSKQGLIRSANLAATRLLELERAQLEQTKLTDYIVREDQDILYLGLQRARQEHPSQEFELRMVTPAGRQVYVALQCERMEAQGQDTGQMRVTLSDITHRQEQAQALQAYAQRLEGLNKDLEAFAYVVSHDLKEPLHKIKAFGKLLLDHSSQIDEEGRDYVRRMQQAAERMEKLIDAILALSRLSTKTPDFQPVDLNQVVQAAAADLDLRRQETGGKIEIGPLPHLTASPVQMQQLFANLLGNALKFHQAGVAPQVQVTAGPIADGKIEIQVRDHGIGFEPEAVSKLFKPFARLHGKSEYQGTGMGLAICRKIVENHGGTITAHSAPGQGATFIITLPVLPPGARSAGDLPAPSGSKKEPLP